MTFWNSQNILTLWTPISSLRPRLKRMVKPFLVTFVHLDDEARGGSKNKRGTPRAPPLDRHCRITVYRNPPTQTDQYPVHKRFVCFVFRTLIHLAENLVTNDKDEKEETEHVKSALRANGYPECMDLPNFPKKLNLALVSVKQSV